MPEGIAAIGKDPRSALLERLDLHVAARLEVATAPGAVRQLQRRACAAAGTCTSPLQDGLVRIVDRIRRGLLPHPQADAKRLRTPGFRNMRQGANPPIVNLRDRPVAASSKRFCRRIETWKLLLFGLVGFFQFLEWVGDSTF